MLEQLKNLLGIETDGIDNKLYSILEMAGKRLCILIGEKSVPKDLEYIVVEVSVVRYNRIGSEGLSSHSVEGESASFASDDFEPYKNEIQAYIDSKSESTRGKLVFL